MLIRNEATDNEIPFRKRTLHVTYLGKLNKEYSRSEKIKFFKGSSGFTDEFEDLLNLYSRDLSILEVLPTVKEQTHINLAFKAYNKYDGEKVARDVLKTFFNIEEKLKFKIKIVLSGCLTTYAHKKFQIRRSSNWLKVKIRLIKRQVFSLRDQFTRTRNISNSFKRTRSTFTKKF